MTEEELPKLVKKIEALGKNIENDKSKLSNVCLLDIVFYVYHVLDHVS